MNLRYLSKVFGCDITYTGTSHWVAGRWASVFMQCNDSPIYDADVFPSVSGIESIAKYGIEYPNRCCICNEPAVDRLKPLAPPLHLRLSPFWPYYRKIDQSPVPHCSKHAKRKHACFLAAVLSRGSADTIVLLWGKCLGFLTAVHESYSQGDYPPPWLFNPNLPPESGWNLGTTEESWVHDTWRPFWGRLSHSERLAYLDRHAAPDHWRDELIARTGTTLVHLY